MGNRIVVVESPNKVEKIKGFLGAGWQVFATMGHFRDMPVKESKEHGLGYDSKTWKPFYVMAPEKEDRIARIKAAARNASEIYLATDPDREGEAISYHLVEVLGLKNGSYRRAKFNEITEDAIKAAIKNAGDLNEPLVRAQEARRVLDRMVGYRVSSVVKTSAGRVQSPALRLIVDREREIRSFKKVNHFGVLAKNPGGWRAQWDTRQVLRETEDYLLDRGIADRVAATKTLVVISCVEGERTRQPPDPFTTSSLAQAASSRLKWDVEKTARVSQKLFEAGEITYIRTDSPVLSNEAVAEIRAYLAAHKLPFPTVPRRAKAKGNAQEAHEAIRPTHIERVNAGDTPEEIMLYELIRNRTLASQMEGAKYATRKVIFESLDATVRPPAALAGGPPGSPELARFKASGETLTSKGWLAVYDETEEVAAPKKGAKRDEGAEEEALMAASNPLPPMVPGSQHPVVCEVQAKATRPPKRFTEATLIKRLEEEQIGRPSTYVSIMSTLKRKYVTVDSARHLVPNDSAESTIDQLVNGKFSFIELGFTRLMEAALDEIAQSNDPGSHYLKVMKAFDDRLTNELNNVPAKPSGPQSPGAGAASTSTGSLPSARAGAGAGQNPYRPAGAGNAAKSNPIATPMRPSASAAPASSGAASKPAAPVEGAGKPCPKCKQGSLRAVQVTKPGPNQGKTFLACTNREACKHIEFPAAQWSKAG